MDAVRKSFAVELTKIAAESSQQKKRDSYPKAVAAALPFAIGKGVTDVPKGMVDKAVEGKIRSGKTPSLKDIAGRGVGRGAGFAAGAATAPLFLSGMRDIKEGKTEKERKRGYAKITASGLAYGAGKGGIEAAIEKGVKGPEALRAIKKTMGSRGLVAAGAGALTAASVAKSLQKPKKGQKKQGKKEKYVAPTAVGGLAGAGKGAFDEIYEKGIKSVKTPKGIRGVAARAGGRAAAGALGAVALRELTRKALQPSENEKGHWRKLPAGKRGKDASGNPVPGRTWVKTAGIADGVSLPDARPMYLGPRPGELYHQVHGWAKDADTRQLQHQFQTAIAAGQGERSPSRRAVTYAMADELERRGERVPPLPMRQHVNRPDLVENPTFVDNIMVASAVALPWAFMKGINQNMPIEQRDKVLMDAMDRMSAHVGIQRIQAGQDFWGPTFTKAPEEGAYRFGTMGDPTTRRAVERLEAEGTAQARDLAQKVRQGHKRFVSLRPDSRPEAYAHELGHVTGGEFRQKLIQPTARKANAVGRATSIVVPLLALEGAPDKSFATPEELEARANFISSAGKVALALQAPVLLEEGLASLKGLGIMAAAGASRGRLLESIVHLGVPVATRALPAALPFVAARHLRRKAEKGRERARR